MTPIVRLAIDWGERLFVVLLAIPFLLAFASALPTHPNSILLAISELLTVAFILIRRPGEVSIAPYPVLIAMGGSAFPLLVRPGGTSLLASEITSIIMLCGLVISIASKLYLNRSFGCFAANRGVKVGGPYRIVRHPMYLGYIITQVGFLLANFDVRNVAIYAAAWTFQILRVREEESVLCRDPAYRDFTQSVSSRLIPGVY